MKKDKDNKKYKEFKNIKRDNKNFQFNKKKFNNKYIKINNTNNK